MILEKKFVTTLLMLSLLVAGCSRSNQLEKVEMKDESLTSELSIDVRPKVLAIGQGFSIGVKKDGTVWSWGSNHNGALGRKTESQEQGYVPARVPGISEVVSVVADECVLVLKKDGSVWSWGSNRSGQLGYKTMTGYSSEPRKVDGLSDIVDIATGAGAALALKKDGTVLGWGSGAAGLLGDGVARNNNGIRPILGLENIVRIEMRHAIDRYGRLWVYGIDPNLSARGADKENAITPGIARIPGRVVSVSARGDAAMALTESGHVFSWGYNNGGQLGLGHDLSRIVDIPERVTSLSKVTLLASNYGAAIATESGSVAVWGVSASAPPPPAPLPRKDLFTPHRLQGAMAPPLQYLAGGMATYAAIDANGTTWYWMDNSRGQRGVGSAVTIPNAEYWTTPEKSLWKYE